jgi:hypothetical protein
MGGGALGPRLDFDGRSSDYHFNSQREIALSGSTIPFCQYLE